MSRDTTTKYRVQSSGRFVDSGDATFLTQKGPSGEKIVTISRDAYLSGISAAGGVLTRMNSRSLASSALTQRKK